MRFTGKLKEPIIDFVTHRLTILFEPQQDFSQAYEELKDCEKLSLEIKRYRRKRSLDANAYYWVLLTKLANAMQTSNPEMHNRMLIHYGQPEIIEGKAIYMTIPDTEEAERKVKFTSRENARYGVCFAVFFSCFWRCLSVFQSGWR